MPVEFLIEHLSPAKLTAHPLNWGKHSERQKSAVAQSLGDFGWLAPVVWNKRTGHLLDGHARVEHARKVGAETVPVRVLDVDEATEKRILATIDRVGELRERDDLALMALLKECATEGDLPTGWDVIDYEKLALSLAPEERSGNAGVAEGEEDEEIPPVEFPAFDEAIETEFVCPKCSYQWSGRPN